MSSDAFMLPALPQLPAPGFNGTDARSPAVDKFDRMPGSTDKNSSFLATLKQISGRQHGSDPRAAAADKPAATARNADAQSPKSQKTGQAAEGAADAVAGDEAPLSARFKEKTSAHHLRQAFDWMVCQLMNVSMADDDSLAVRPVSDSAAGTELLTFGDWIGQLQSQRQAVQGDLVGIGPFEQMQANISPEATNWLLFEQLALRAFALQGGGSQPEALVEAGTQNGLTESSGVNGNPLPNMLPHLPEMGTIDTALGLNSDTGNSGGPNGTVGPEMTHLDPDLIKTAAPSQTAETGLTDGVKMAVADSSGLLPFGASVDGDSDTPLEAQARKSNANMQPLKVQADLQVSAEQPAGPNPIVESIGARAPEEVFGIKSAASKDEITAGDVFGNKLAQIDGDNKDSSLLFSQDQMPQHLARLENATHSAESAPRSLMPQTLDQIVQKAVLSFNNGQHEVQIDLKPDFLGHIRMEIVSEGHQVAIRIVAEHPFVKDMLENNLHQLKTELQAQGLDINELEVSVAHDSRGQGDARQTAKAAKVSAVRGLTDLDDGSSEKQSQSRFQGGGTTAVTAVDYFA